MEQKDIVITQAKMVTEGHGQFSGYASTFANWDSVRERPVKGAFLPHLASFLTDGFIALGHDWGSPPVATVDEAREDDYGLWLKADFHSSIAAQEARKVVQERIERGKSVKMSIGYEVLKDEYVEEGRLLKEIKLFEVSLVNVPANPLASVTGAKGAVSAPLADHSDAVVSAVEELTARMKANADIRVKEGRVLSAANRNRITAILESLAGLDGIREELAALLAETETPKSLAETHALRAESVRLLQRIRELGVTA